MGKKKRGGSGKKSKGRAPLKDHGSQAEDDNELLAEEITALCAIFGEDCKVVAGSTPQIVVKIRPHSKDMGYDDVDVSALLFVRCLPGYPYKCPKVNITPEKGLSESDADKLLSLLHDQANANAREGRVMIFNLVETAQEFLSEIVPAEHPHASGLCSTSDGGDPLFLDTSFASTKTCSPRGPFVYGFIDLFCGSGESWHWGPGMEESSGMNSVQSHTFDGSKLGHRVQEKKFVDNANPLTKQDAKRGPLLSSTTKLDTLEEESGDDSKSLSTSNSSMSSVDELVGNGINNAGGHFFLEGNTTEDDDGDFESFFTESPSSGTLVDDQSSQTVERDLMMVHLLRLACASKGPVSDALPQIATELYKLGIFSESVRDLASKPSSLFDKAFSRVFRQHVVSSKISQFWKPASDFEGPSTPSSRYLNDFEELRSLGIRHTLDGTSFRACRKIYMYNCNYFLAIY